jgi:hypothetical protein
MRMLDIGDVVRTVEPFNGQWEPFCLAARERQRHERVELLDAIVSLALPLRLDYRC